MITLKNIKANGGSRRKSRRLWRWNASGHGTFCGRGMNGLAAKGITEITKEVLLENKVIRRKKLWVKLLGKGELKSKVSLKISSSSASAKEAVEKAWGSIELI